MSIPMNRAVIFADMREVVEGRGGNTNDALPIYGISMTDWSKLGKGAPVHQRLRLLTRMIELEPRLDLVVRYPSPQEVFDKLNKYVEMDKREFVQLFGTQANAAQRWFSSRPNAHPAARRMMKHFMEILALNKGKEKEIIRQWIEIVNAERRHDSPGEEVGAISPLAPKGARKAAKGAGAKAAGETAKSVKSAVKAPKRTPARKSS